MIGVQQVAREETTSYGIVDSKPISEHLETIQRIVEKPKPDEERIHSLVDEGIESARTGAHPHTSGVCFTGSTAVARFINRSLAAKDGPIVPLIAETGGLNAMVVDSTALPEQVIDAVVQSAFRSAGQRC